MFAKIFIHLIVLTFLTTFCYGEDYINTPYNSSSGLYYEKVGTVLLSNDNWQFVTSIDYKGYLLFYEYLKHQSSKFEEFCYHHAYNYCHERLQDIGATMTELAETDQNMGQFLGLNTGKRIKRNWALVIPAILPLLQPFADGLSNKLFGSKNMPDLSVYEKQIQLLKESQEDLINQINMQSTIYKIDSEKKTEDIAKLELTRNRIELELKIHNQTIEQNSADVKEKTATLQSLLEDSNNQIQKLKEAQQQLNKETMKVTESVASIEEGMQYLKNQSNKNKHEIDDIIVRSKLDRITADFHIVLSRFKFQQKTLFDVLVNANRGFLDPYILTPLNLINMMMEAQPYLNEEYTFPYHPTFENAKTLYKLIEPTFHLYNGSIIWILKMNLVKHKTYNLFKMTSFPVPLTPKTFAFIIPQQPFILVDQEESEHTLVSKSDFQISCKTIENGRFLCTGIQTNYVHQFLDCEVRIFLSKEIDPDQCQIRLITLQETLFLQLLEFKTWIYAAASPTDVTVSCNTVQSIIPILNTGFLQLGKCNPIGKHIFLQPYLDSKITNIYGNYSTKSVNLKKFIEMKPLLRSFTEQRNIEPFNFEYLKRSSTGLREIGEANSGDEKPSQDVQNAVIIGVIFLAVLTIFIGICLARNQLQKFGHFLISNNINLQAIKT